MQTVQKSFRSFILSYKASKKQLCYVVPRTKVAHAIISIFSPNIKLGPNWQQSTTKMALAGLGCSGYSSEVFHIIVLSYKVSKKTALLCCTAKKGRTDHNLHYQSKHPALAKLTAINNKNGCGTAEVLWRKFLRVSYHWYYYIRLGKTQLWSVVPPTNLVQAISSIFSPKIQLKTNWQ